MAFVQTTDDTALLFDRHCWWNQHGDELLTRKGIDAGLRGGAIKTLGA